MTVIARIYILRHGETDSNRNKIIQGQLDTELNAHGTTQAGRVAEALKGAHFDRAFSSDLQRAVKTAEQILAYHPGIALEKQEALRERFMGERQGELVSSNKPAPSLEQGDAFVVRCLSWWNHTILGYVSSIVPDAKLDGRCRSALVVTHGGFIGTLVRSLVANRALTCADGITIGRCSNTSITLVEFRSVGRPSLEGRVLNYADASHLEGMSQVEVNVDEI